MVRSRLPQARRDRSTRRADSGRAARRLPGSRPEDRPRRVERWDRQGRPRSWPGSTGRSAPRLGASWRGPRPTRARTHDHGTGWSRGPRARTRRGCRSRRESVGDAVGISWLLREFSTAALTQSVNDAWELTAPESPALRDGAGADRAMALKLGLRGLSRAARDGGGAGTVSWRRLRPRLRGVRSPSAPSSSARWRAGRHATARRPRRTPPARRGSARRSVIRGSGSMDDHRNGAC